MRKIIHIDMDAFFASIEQRDNPDLRGKPVAVGGASKRGVVAAASYEARKFGVHSAMPGAIARRKCPQLIFVRHRFEVYKEVSQQIREIFFDYTDLVEPLSLDEAFLDVTQNKKNRTSAMGIAMDIRKRIKKTTELTASAGVSFNKFLAKVASDLHKPDGLSVILPEQAEAFLEELPIHKFFGIGKVTASRMKDMGIYNGADLKKFSELELVSRFGKAGRFYYRIVRAEDERPVNPNRIRKSIGAERTFSENLTDFHNMWDRLEDIAERVWMYMNKTQNYGRTITLKMKKPDFQIISRSKTFSSDLSHKKRFIEQSKQLLELHWQEAGSVRLLGIAVSNLRFEHIEYGIQLELNFEEE